MASRAITVDVDEHTICVQLAADGSARLEMQGRNEQDYLSASFDSGDDLAHELRELADFAAGSSQKPTIRVSRGFVLDPRVRGLSDAAFRLYVMAWGIAEHDKDGMLCARYGTAADLAGLAGLEETEGRYSLTEGLIKELEAEDLVRHNSGGRCLVMMR